MTALIACAISFVIARGLAVIPTLPEYDRNVNVEVQKGEVARLKCLVASSDATVKWIKEPNLLISINMHVVSPLKRRMVIQKPLASEWNLLINHVRESDTGYYTCRNGDLVVSRVQLRLLELPTFLDTSEDVIADENESLRLWCNATGYPTPIVTWYERTPSQSPDDVVNTGVVGRMLAIQTGSHGSDDAYICNASNSIGSVTKEIRVRVKSGPVIQTCDSSQVMLHGDNAILKLWCNATGTPSPILRWYLGASYQYGKSQQGLHLLGEGNLLQTTVSRYDDAVFVCEATNIHGVATREIRITAKPPSDSNNIQSGMPPLSQDCLPMNSRPTDCQDVKRLGCTTSGIYIIYPAGTDGFRVRCDQDTSGGGWTVFQRRFDGDVDFYQKWASYQVGFGDLESEFWLGNQQIYMISSQGWYELRVDLTDAKGHAWFATYNVFRVSDAEKKYRLFVDGYNGNAGNNFKFNSGNMFSTVDQDNDNVQATDFSSVLKGAWWYGETNESNLNARYNSSLRTERIFWKGIADDGQSSVVLTEMKMRKWVDKRNIYTGFP
ncbi:hypothetical protein CHS0354_026153 [Potamilus streckersoni]|uniref:Uncharacterized protein n=1 Tax=Potamilus streckersoni TaxID=2493646 RepID=A0AAE0S1V7_9BIVA|nr:hypothetical protein CHS0354_026153 [Potamilus streckersoni]